jgi:hypothetical protein
MSAPHPAVPDAPRLRPGTTLTELNRGSVLVRGQETDAFITDEGTAGVLQACDGRTLAGLSAGLRERFGWGLTPDDLREILTKWARYGYLDGTPLPRRRLVRIDPAPLLRLLRPLAGLYGRGGLAALAALAALAGLGLTLRFGAGLLEPLSRLIRSAPPWGALATMVCYYVGYMVTAFWHELGHALAVHRLGGEVPEIGVQRSLNFYVLSNREVLQTTQEKLWYYGGGLLSDTFWWLGAWIWWLLAPGYMPLFLLVPQCVYFIILAWAPTGASDMALMLQSALGWGLLPRAFRQEGWAGRWRRAPRPQVLLEGLRLAASTALLVYVAWHDVLLILVYALYRMARRGMNRL